MFGVSNAVNTDNGEKDDYDFCDDIATAAKSTAHFYSDPDAAVKPKGPTNPDQKSVPVLVANGLHGITQPATAAVQAAAPAQKKSDIKHDSTRDILLVLDLDYTHFKTHKNGVVWIGSEKFWIDLYAKLEALVTKAGGRLIFAIVTKKDGVDELVLAAINAFQAFLKKHNPDMFVYSDYCMVNVMGKLLHQYQPGGSSGIEVEDSRGKFSNVVMIGPDIHIKKSPTILELGKNFGIPASRTILLDDTRDVLIDAKNSGIETVSCECFHGYEQRTLILLDNENYVSENLQRIQNELTGKVNQLMEFTYTRIPDAAMEAAISEAISTDYYPRPGV